MPNKSTSFPSHTAKILSIYIFCTHSIQSVRIGTNLVSIFPNMIICVIFRNALKCTKEKVSCKIFNFYAIRLILCDQILTEEFIHSFIGSYLISIKRFRPIITVFVNNFFYAFAFHARFLPCLANSNHLLMYLQKQDLHFRVSTGV